MDLISLNKYCHKIKTLRPSWHKDILKSYLICQMEQEVAPELRNLYVFDNEKDCFEIDSKRIDYQI